MVLALITNSILYNNEKLRLALFTIGAGFILFKAISVVKFLLVSLQPAIDLPSRYGSKSWVFITGGSEGIGKAFALNLAGQGFNIVLVSRTKAKLEEAQKEIKSKYPSSEVRIIVADLSKAYEDGVINNVYNQIKDLDISILINNVGKGLMKPFINVSDDEIRDIISINCLTHAQMTRIFLPKLTSRSQRSAIINVASIASISPLPKVQLYAATKAFHDFLSRGLNYEYPKIDIMSLKPGTVSTALSNYRKLDSETITPDECVIAALKDLGRKNESFGHYKHKFQAYMASITPKFILDIYINNILMKSSKYD